MGIGVEVGCGVGVAGVDVDCGVDVVGVDVAGVDDGCGVDVPGVPDGSGVDVPPGPMISISMVVLTLPKSLTTFTLMVLTPGALHFFVR